MVTTLDIPLFTPVETECWLMSLPARYTSPFFGNKTIAVLDPTEESINGSQACVLKNHETICIETALKILTYVLSCGILPCLALLLNLVIRCVHQFHVVEAVSNPPSGSQEELQENDPVQIDQPSQPVQAFSELLEPSGEEDTLPPTAPKAPPKLVLTSDEITIEDEGETEFEEMF